MPDSLRRAIRTLLQMVVAGAFTGLVNQFVTDIPARYAPYVLVGFTLLTSFSQNYLEDHSGLPAVLKSPPSSGHNPVPDNAGPAV